MSRPSKLTPEVHETIIDSVKAGMTYRLACVRVDIDESTLYRWLTAGETQVRGQFCEFRKDFMRAIADSAEVLLNQIRVKAPTDWRAAAFMLERRFPDDYGRRTEVTGKDGGPVKVDTKTEHVFQPTQEVWDDVLRERAKYERLRDGDTDEDTASDGL